MTFKDIITVGTNASGIAQPTMTLGIATTTSVPPIGSFVGRAATMAGLYRQVYLNNVQFRWIPCASTSASGTTVMGIDQAITAIAPTNVQQVYHHVPSVMADIKAPASISWNAKQALKNDYKYTGTLTGLDEDALSFGVFQCYATGPASSQIGIIEIIIDLTFTGPV